MTVVVLTVDQRGSRTSPDLVPDAARRPGRPAAAAGLRAHGRATSSRACSTTPTALAPAVERLLRDDAWNIGIGVGAVDEPLPDHARAGRGPAYLHARDGGHRRQEQPLAPRASPATTPAARDLETVLWLWAAVLGRRTDKGLGGRRPRRPGPVVRRGRPRGSASASPRSASAPRPPAWSRDGGPASWSTRLAARLLGKDDRDTPVRTGAPLVTGAAGLRAGRAPGGLVRVRVRRIWAPATPAAARSRPGRRGAHRSSVTVDGRRRDHPARRSRPALLAVAGGGPLTALVFELVDRPRAAADESHGARPAAVLRGGTWIGAPGAGRDLRARSSPAGPRASRSCSPSRASAATRSCGGRGRHPHRRRRALHHRHLHQRAVGGRLRRCRPGCCAEAQAGRRWPGSRAG